MNEKNRCAGAGTMWIAMAGAGVLLTLHVQPARAQSNETSGANAPAQSSPGLEEIIVTAQKRSERLLDVPFSVGVISGDTLEELNSGSLSDLAGYVPGLTIQQYGSPGHNSVVIRGLSTNYNNGALAPLVATYIDDAPVGATNNGATAGAFGLDLMPFDIERLEVLRGPQGTLYGADAMGGIVKYSLRKPNLTQFDARVGSDLTGVDGGGGMGWAARAAINAPLVTERLGLRVSGFHADNAGYIDNVGTQTRDANHLTQSGGRAALLWQPTERLSLEGSFLAQNVDQDDVTGVTVDPVTLQPVYGRLVRATNFAEPFAQETRFAALKLDWDLTFATFTSSTSWSRLATDATFDLGTTDAALVPGNPDAISLYGLENRVSKYVEEARLASPQDQRMQWMLGGLYTKEDNGKGVSWVTYTPQKVPLPLEDALQLSRTKGEYREWAAFANTTYTFTTRFDLSGGIRYASNSDSGCTLQSSGVLGTGARPCTTRPYQGKVTWMTNARVHVSPDAMAYARVATGYRPGGGCTTCGNPALGIPNFYYSDSLTNYEVGFKGQLLEKRLQIDLSMFYIDWSNIQIEVRSPVSNNIHFTGNGASASSRGVELTTSYQMTRSVQVTTNLDYTNAYLTHDAPVGGGVAGDPLPQSPRWSASVLANYTRPFGERNAVKLGGGYRYRDKVYNQFAHTSAPLPMGPQNIFDLSGGLVLDRTTIQLFAKNVFNNDSYTGLLYLADPRRPMFNPVQPRTIGLSIDVSF